MVWSSYALLLLFTLGVGIAFWIVSVWRRDVSIVDTLWSLMFLAITLGYAWLEGVSGPRGWLLIGLVSVWSLRLSYYITARNHGEPEDHRYQKIRANNQPGFVWKSLYIVFAFQVLMAWLIAMPLAVAVSSDTALGWLDLAGGALWVLGMVFEVGGDRQLARFKSDPSNRGQVLDTGLWRYTRHPNYFGECALWWGYYLMACAAGGWWTLASPLLMSFLLLRVSGVALLEQDIGERRPAYAEYIQRTNAFFPGPPRRAAVSAADE